MRSAGQSCSTKPKRQLTLVIGCVTLSATMRYAHDFGLFPIVCYLSLYTTVNKFVMVTVHMPSRRDVTNFVISV